MEKTSSQFSTRDIAEFKRTAQNVWPLQNKKIKIEAKIAELSAELATLDTQIELKQAYVKHVTGYSVFDLINRNVTITPCANEDGTPKLDDKGKQVITTTVEYTLKYPETVVPVTEVPEIESTFGSDFDLDATKVEEIETSALGAPFNPINI